MTPEEKFMLAKKYIKGTYTQGAEILKVKIRKASKKFIKGKLIPLELIDGSIIINFKGYFILVEIEKGFIEKTFLKEKKDLIEINGCTLRQIKEGVLIHKNN